MSDLRCQGCARSVSESMHASSLSTRSSIDKKLWPKVERELESRTHSTSEGEVDDVGNPVFCVECLAKAITKARGR